jgi:Family of unknown function (DUF5681)
MSDKEDPATRSYRNPPIEHRFRKGVSGNPKGRPRKIRALVATKIGGQPGIGFEDPIKSLAIKEAYRIIPIREGDRVEKIPVIQVILRKVAVDAAKGNIRAQQNILSLVIGAEADRRVATMELLKNAVDYKEHWHHVLAERARKGTTGPEPVPHPDDVIIDFDTGEFRIDGPVLEEQHLAQERLREMWPDLLERLWKIEKQIESDPQIWNCVRKKRCLTQSLAGLSKTQGDAPRETH